MTVHGSNPQSYFQRTPMIFAAHISNERECAKRVLEIVGRIPDFYFDSPAEEAPAKRVRCVNRDEPGAEERDAIADPLSFVEVVGAE